MRHIQVFDFHVRGPLRKKYVLSPTQLQLLRAHYASSVGTMTGFSGQQQCSIEVVSGAPRMFLAISAQNGSYGMSMCTSTAQDKMLAPDCVRHFPCKFPHFMYLVTCPCACAHRRFTQNRCRSTRVLGFPVYTFSCDMSVRV